VFVVAALLLHLIAPFPHAAAICGVLYVAYCFLLDRAAQASTSSSSRPSAAACRRQSPLASLRSCRIEVAVVRMRAGTVFLVEGEERKIMGVVAQVICWMLQCLIES
jgi:hypothetical protein